MKLTIIETPRATKTFGELRPGDVFRFAADIYMKVATPNPENAVNFTNSCGGCRFLDGSGVEPLDAELIVRPLQ